MTDEIEKPSGGLLQALWREDVGEETRAQWDEALDTNIQPEDYGHCGTLVFRRKADDTHWAVNYTEQSDYNSFRDEDPADYEVYRVYPTVVITTEYRPSPAALTHEAQEKVRNLAAILNEKA